MRSIVSFVASAASSALYVPMRFTRIVRTGLSITVSTPAIAAACTRCVAPFRTSVRNGASRTSPWTKVKLGWSASVVPPSVSRCRLSTATMSFSSTSCRASVVPMKPAPPVTTIRFPLRATRASLRSVYPTRERRGPSDRRTARAANTLRACARMCRARRCRCGAGRVCRRRRLADDDPRVTYWENSAAPARSVTWTLRCNPAGGTLDARRPRMRAAGVGRREALRSAPAKRRLHRDLRRAAAGAGRRNRERAARPGDVHAGRTAARSHVGSGSRRGSFPRAA